jgi:hypothetical protein
MPSRCGDELRLSREFWETTAVVKVYYGVREKTERRKYVVGSEDATGCSRVASDVKGATVLNFVEESVPS